MGYFPFFIDIADKKIVIVGGGNVALGKTERLMSFSPDITVIAPYICDEIAALEGVKLIRRPFSDDDIEGAFAVIAATDDTSLNEHIFRLASQKNILINTVDDKEKCSFIFPALVKKDNITVGISTSGKSPLFAKHLRSRIEQQLDDKMINALDMLGKYRSVIKSRFRTEEGKKEAFEAILGLCLDSSTPPDDNEIMQLTERLVDKYDS